MDTGVEWRAMNGDVPVGVLFSQVSGGGRCGSCRRLGGDLLYMIRSDDVRLDKVEKEKSRKN